jgi:hypothetical protein
VFEGGDPPEMQALTEATGGSTTATTLWCQTYLHRGDSDDHP